MEAPEGWIGSTSDPWDEFRGDNEVDGMEVEKAITSENKEREEKTSDSPKTIPGLLSTTEDERSLELTDVSVKSKTSKKMKGEVEIDIVNNNIKTVEDDELKDASIKEQSYAETGTQSKEKLKVLRKSEVDLSRARACNEDVMHTEPREELSVNKLPTEPESPLSTINLTVSSDGKSKRGRKRRYRPWACDPILGDISVSPLAKPDSTVAMLKTAHEQLRAAKEEVVILKTVVAEKDKEIGRLYELLEKVFDYSS